MIRKSTLVLAVLFLTSLCFSQTQTKKRSSHPQASPPETAKAAAGAIDEKLFGAMRWRLETCIEYAKTRPRVF